MPRATKINRSFITITMLAAFLCKMFLSGRLTGISSIGLSGRCIFYIGTALYLLMPVMTVVSVSVCRWGLTPVPLAMMTVASV